MKEFIWVDVFKVLGPFFSSSDVATGEKEIFFYGYTFWIHDAVYFALDSEAVLFTERK